MDKKDDGPKYITSPAGSAPGMARRSVPHMPGVIIQKSVATESQASPAAAEPLPVSRWPRIDQYLDEPDEVERWERIGGKKKWASPATPKHADPHFTLDQVLGAHLAEGYVGSTDLKTRVDAKHEYASDTCVRREGAPEDASRHLEELVFEVVYKRSKAETDIRARGFAARGVRRQIGIFVKKKQVREWLKSEEDWGPPLDLAGRLHDPCLAVPLPLAALFDPVVGRKSIPLALEAKGDPTILEMKKKSKNRGRAEGLAEGLLALLKSRGYAVSGELRDRICATTDFEILERWLLQASSASLLDEVFKLKSGE